MSKAKYNTATDTKRNILNKSMMGGNSSAEALSANNRSTTMATGVPVALTSTHTPSIPRMQKKLFIFLDIYLLFLLH